MAAENRLRGQKRIQPELARLGFEVSARTVAKHMSRHLSRGPSLGWREFLRRHESNIWACDFFCVRTILFQTLYVFFVGRHVNREILHIALTPCPTTEWNGGAERIIVQCYPEQSFALNSLPFVCDKIDSLIYFRAVRELRLDLS